ncbi:hypothetical protein BDB01DRAFT_832627 [Pilobolus umbonatus]|nr:hypothetical protein BDB01DRAFT_832627 [Pilobolus umbonatus]
MYSIGEYRVNQSGYLQCLDLKKKSLHQIVIAFFFLVMTIKGGFVLVWIIIKWNKSYPKNLTNNNIGIVSFDYLGWIIQGENMNEVTSTPIFLIVYPNLILSRQVGEIEGNRVAEKTTNMKIKRCYVFQITVNVVLTVHLELGKSLPDRFSIFRWIIHINDWNTRHTGGLLMQSGVDQLLRDYLGIDIRYISSVYIGVSKS